MTLVISGAGQTLPVPQNLYPSELLNAPLDAPTNYLGMAAGDALPIPAQSNEYLINLGNACGIEVLDAPTGTWRIQSDMSRRPGVSYIRSNGVDKRISNRTGCPVAALIANGGSGFTQATAAITANVGGSTWQAVVGGSLTLTTISNAGLNYTVPPLVMIPAPTPAGANGSVGGVPAVAYAALTSGSVSAVTFDDVGAGYLFAPTAVLVPSPYDTNFATITPATIVLALNPATTGAITAALCTNFGAPLATISALTLTAAGGAGTGATITPQVLQTVLSASVVAGGAGFGTVGAPPFVTTVGGGATSVAAISNPSIDFSGFVPRPAILNAVTNAGGTITTVTVVDGGMFISAPTAVVASGGTLPTTLSSITLVTGAQHGKAFLQPL
jgi:hypothetical protein